MALSPPVFAVLFHWSSPISLHGSHENIPTKTSVSRSIPKCDLALLINPKRKPQLVNTQPHKHTFTHTYTQVGQPSFACKEPLPNEPLVSPNRSIDRSEPKQKPATPKSIRISDFFSLPPFLPLFVLHIALHNLRIVSFALIEQGIFRNKGEKEKSSLARFNKRQRKRKKSV